MPARFRLSRALIATSSAVTSRNTSVTCTNPRQVVPFAAGGWDTLTCQVGAQYALLFISSNFPQWNTCQSDFRRLNNPWFRCWPKDPHQRQSDSFGKKIVLLTRPAFYFQSTWRYNTRGSRSQPNGAQSAWRPSKNWRTTWSWRTRCQSRKRMNSTKGTMM